VPTGSLDIISRPARIGIPGLVSTDQASEHVLSLAVAHATATLNRHWLSVPERVTFKLCVMVYRCLHGIGPEYFSEDFRLMSEIYSRQRLRSASSTDVVVPATRQSSLGDRAFPVAGARAWNALPPSVTAAPSLSSFRRFLKTFLFQRQLRQ